MVADIEHSRFSKSLDLPLYQGRIQACFDSVQLLWAPTKTAQIFLQVQINNRIFR